MLPLSFLFFMIALLSGAVCFADFPVRAAGVAENLFATCMAFFVISVIASKGTKVRQ